MSRMSWQDQLKYRIEEIPEKKIPIKVAVVGVGNPLLGDDGVGVIVTRELGRFFGETPAVLVIMAGIAPENITGQLRRFQPDFILFVDAAEMGMLPGEVGVWSYEDCGGDLVSTHTLPLSVVCSYLKSELNCQIAILGIQPAKMGPYGELSLQITPDLKEVVAGIIFVLGQIPGVNITGSEDVAEIYHHAVLETCSPTLRKELKIYDCEYFT